MEEEEERRAGVVFNPMFGGGCDLFAGAFVLDRGAGGIVVDVERAVVRFEPTAKAEAAVEDETADEGAGVIAGFLEEGSEGGGVGAEGDAVVENAIAEGIGGGEEGDVRGEGKRERSGGLGEERAVFGEAVDMGGLGGRGGRRGGCRRK